MNCSEFQVKADALLDANNGSSTTLLSSGERTALESHLQDCKSCRTEFQIARTIRDLYRSRFHYRQTPTDTIERVHRAVEQEALRASMRDDA